MNVLASDKKYCENLELHFDNNIMNVGSFVVQKNSQLSHLLSDSIRRAVPYRKYQSINDIWNKTIDCTRFEKKFTQFSNEYFYGYLIIMACAVVIAIVVLFVETWYEKSRMGKVEPCHSTDLSEHSQTAWNEQGTSTIIMVQPRGSTSAINTF